VRTFAHVFDGGKATVTRIAIIVSHGSFNNIFQVSTLVRTLAGWPGTSIRVFFRDESVVKLTTARINEYNFSPMVQEGASQIVARLKEAEFTDLHSFLKDSKEHGDDVKFFACTSSMYMYGVNESDLIPEIDEPKALGDFLREDVAGADRVFTF
jgi:peroxiredoxin family protein